VLQAQIPDLIQIQLSKLANKQLQGEQCAAGVAVSVGQFAVPMFVFLHRRAEPFNFIEGDLQL
jgi:hypothetical protein